MFVCVCGHFLRISYFSANKDEMGCWESEILGKWDLGKVGFWEFRILGNWDVGKIAILGK